MELMTTFYMPDGTMEIMNDDASGKAPKRHDMNGFSRMVRSRYGDEIANYFDGIVAELIDDLQATAVENLRLEKEWSDAQFDIQSLHEKLNQIAQDIRGMRDIVDKYPWLENMSKFLNIVEKECEY